MDLSIWGWNSFFARHFEPFAGRGFVPGRVIAEHKHVYRVRAEYGEVLAEVSGRMRYEAYSRAAFPAVGDWVALDPAGESRATIHSVLPRLSKFSRRAAGEQAEEQIVAANINTVFLVSALNQEFNARRIERYLALAWESGANPVIVLNKADLCGEVEKLTREAQSAAPGVPVHAVSCARNIGLEALEPYLGEKGATVALLGSSGVGKSTLINVFTGKEMRRVNEIRCDDDRGRHTTTHRELLLLPSGGMVIDTPGMRELQLWNAGEGMQDAFEDIETLAGQCRFRDCRHESEPLCAVKRALEQGELDPSRYENYLKLRRELDFLAGKDQLEVRLARKEKAKKLGKLQKRIKNR